MMDWTDRHCRFFHRQFSKRALLYTEMVTAPAVLHGERDRLLAHDQLEHPLALQLGGSDPSQLAEATRVACGHGIDEINLNVGCPSDRVQSGTFGAVLMRDPDVVARCAEAMIVASDGPEITVKCRIGVDSQVPEEVLPAFLGTVSDAGVQRFSIHARKAWLQGLSPKQNREVPPLDYDRVYRLKAARSDLTIIINGGITTLKEAHAHLEHVDGVMLGRAAYQKPWLLASVDQEFFGTQAPGRQRDEVLDVMAQYADAHIARGGRLNNVTRHMLGLYHGEAGGRLFRRYIAENVAGRDAASGDVLREAGRFVAETRAAMRLRQDNLAAAD